MRKPYRYVLSIALLALGLLSACGSAAESPLSTIQNTEAVAPTDMPPTTEPDGNQGQADPGAGVFSINASESTARFLIGEVLAGSPNTVVGETHDVNGEIHIDHSDPASVEVGLIQIGAASFVTDNNFRNRAISSFILQSGEFPRITFQATEVVGIPVEVSVGDQFDFQLVGDLTVRDVTQQVTFDISVTVESSTRISGAARARINRSDFNLTIPSVPQVASVEEQVQLELDFVAEG